jgi:hypothetical protein
VLVIRINKKEGSRSKNTLFSELAEVEGKLYDGEYLLLGIRKFSILD